MQKTLLSILAGLMVIGSALAVPSPEDRKAMCQRNPEKYVWVEKDQFCVPINPCLSDSSEIREAYCDTSFNDIKVRDMDAVNVLVDRVSDGKLIPALPHVYKGVNASKYIIATDNPGLISYGTDYRVFEFDQIGYTGAQLSKDSFIAACRVYRGRIEQIEGGIKCIWSEHNCQNIKDLAERLYGDFLDIVSVKKVEREYTGDEYPTYTESIVNCVYKF